MAPVHDQRFVHLAFGESAAGSLMQALRLLGRAERVLCFPDDLGFGPIDPPSGRERARFVRDVMHGEVTRGMGAACERFWIDAAASELPRVAWISRRSVHELTGLLACLARRDDAMLVVDVASAPGMKDLESSSFGCVHHDHIVAHDLLGRAAPLAPDVREAYRRTWARLQAENAPLRVFGPAGLESAPLTYFDDLLISIASDTWTRGMRVVGEALTQLEARGDRPVGDQFLCARMWTLLDDGVLEARGDDDAPLRETWVRRRVSAA